MVLPKGNPLFERVNLPFPDINTLLNNLEQEGFTGYVKLDVARNSGVFFYSNGNILRSVEMEENNIKVNPRARILNRAKKKDISVSTYIFSPHIVEILSLNFAFQPLYLDYEVKQKELKKVMGALEADAYTGVIEFISKEGSIYILIDKGELVTDFFAQEYGQIIAGTETVSNFLNFVSNDGALLNIYAERNEEIENRKRSIEEELDKIKQLIVREDKGWSILKSSDIFWIDEYILQEWGIKTAKMVNLELETPDGIMHLVKAQSNKRLGGYISTQLANMKKYRLNEGDLVSVKPV
jgi:hypothetical protein